MKWTLLLLAIINTIGFTAFAQDATNVRKKTFNLNNSVAIDGYDPVAYFTQNKAAKGNKKKSVAYQGVTYYFSSDENKNTFITNPSKYEPEYGGWCAYAMGNSGGKVSIDPQTFKIINGKLYLFYNRFFTNTLKDWNKNETSLKKAADTNWPKIYH